MKQGVKIWSLDPDGWQWIDLEPCPFCGGAPFLHQFGNPGHGKHGFRVGCKTCRYEMTSAVLKHPLSWLLPRIVARWNTRQDPKIDHEPFTIASFPEQLDFGKGVDEK